MIATVVSFLSSSCIWWGAYAVLFWVSMVFGAECRGTDFFSQLNILCIYLSMKGGTIRSSTPEFRTDLNQAGTILSPSFTKTRIVPSSEKGLFVGVCEGVKSAASSCLKGVAFLVWLCRRDGVLFPCKEGTSVRELLGDGVKRRRSIMAALHNYQRRSVPEGPATW